MRKFLIVCLALLGLADAKAQPSWLPPHFAVPSDSISPNGRYGVMIPDAEGDGPNKLVDMKTGAVLVDLAGEPGWAGNPSMRWGDMSAKWSADSSTLCWMRPDKWFLASYVVLKMQGGRVVWQAELMKAADREILSRTEKAAPLNFAITKLDNAGDGSAYPEGFAIAVSQPEDEFSLPLVCRVSLTSDSKGSEDEPEENGLRSWVTMTVGTDGSLTYSEFKVKAGTLSADAAQRVQASVVNVPLVDTDLGKAMLFPGLVSRDGRYSIGWTIQPATSGGPSIDWSHWDPADPDKLLRRYDWQRYAYMGGVTLPYKAVNFIVDTRTGKTAHLPSEQPNWPGKKDAWEMVAHWYAGANGRRYVLIESGQENDNVANFWLVTLIETQMQVKDLTTTMRKAVDGILRERRPEVAASDFLVSYPLKVGEEAVNESGFAEVPFLANAPDSDQGEFQLSGTITIRLSDGTVATVSSGEKRLEPFVTNKELQKADETLNAIFQTVLKSMPSKDAQAFKQEERDWIVQRDADASQAVNIISGSTQRACEAARESSLLDSTKKRIDELNRRLR